MLNFLSRTRPPPPPPSPPPRRAIAAYAHRKTASGMNMLGGAGAAPMPPRHPRRVPCHLERAQLMMCLASVEHFDLRACERGEAAPRSRRPLAPRQNLTLANKLHVAKKYQQFSLRSYISTLHQNDQPLRLEVGSAQPPGLCKGSWLCTDRNALDLFLADDWAAIFSLESVTAILAEHVLEHLTPLQASIWRRLRTSTSSRADASASRCRTGTAAYQEFIRVGGTPSGQGNRHMVAWTADTLPPIFEGVGFGIELHEYHDATGAFHANPAAYGTIAAWGNITRSYRHDVRNLPGNAPRKRAALARASNSTFRTRALRLTGYTSLWFDAIKPRGTSRVQDSNRFCRYGFRPRHGCAGDHSTSRVTFLPVCSRSFAREASAACCAADCAAQAMLIALAAGSRRTVLAALLPLLSAPPACWADRGRMFVPVLGDLQAGIGGPGGLQLDRAPRSWRNSPNRFRICSSWARTSRIRRTRATLTIPWSFYGSPQSTGSRHRPPWRSPPR